MFNEEGNVEKLADTIQHTLSGEEFDYELILVDDGSTDNTWHLIQKVNASNNRVKGLSLRATLVIRMRCSLAFIMQKGRRS